MRVVAIVVLLYARSAGAAPLTKDDVRASIKQLVPKVGACYEEARRHDAKLGGGVFNLRLSIESTASGVTIKPLDFDTTGRLGESTELRECATRVLATTLAPIAVTGTLVLIYPLTFGDQPPDNRHAKLLAVAKRAAAAGRWRAALATAERGLADVTFDGTVRRKL